MIRVTRVLEYEYETAEDMAKDICGWSLRGYGWHRWNSRKQVRQRIVQVDAVGHEEPPF